MTLDEERIIFQCQLGIAIANWSDIENSLRHLFTRAFEDKELNREALSVGFFSLEGFRPKMLLAEATVARKIAGSKFDDEWAVLIKRTSNLSSSRNKIAHWCVREFPDCGEGTRVALCPWTFPKPSKIPKIKRAPRGSLHTRDIMKIGLEFVALHKTLENFRFRLYAQPEPHPKSHEQAANPSTVESKARLIREVFLPRQKPSAPKP